MIKLSLNDLWYLKNSGMATVTGRFDLSKVPLRVRNAAVEALRTGICPYYTGDCARLLGALKAPVLFKRGRHLPLWGSPLLKNELVVKALKEFSISDAAAAKLASPEAAKSAHVAPWDGKSYYVEIHHRSSGTMKRLRRHLAEYASSPDYKAACDGIIALLREGPTLDVSIN